MKVFYVGDFISLNGPSTVDVNITSIKNTDCEFYKIQSNVLSLLRNFKFFMCADVCHVSGVSFQGFLFHILAIIFNKKRTFTIHGLLRDERKFRYIKFYRIILEYFILLLSTKLFLVSPILTNLLSLSEKNKSYICPNGVDSIPKSPSNLQYKNKNKIMIIGGGRKEKRVLPVCKVIQSLNHKGYNFQLHVFGEECIDSEEIRGFDFVSYNGFKSKSNVLECFNDTYLYIQYSEFETFSLAICEALCEQCIVVSAPNVGVNNYIEEGEFFFVAENDNDLEDCIINTYTKEHVVFEVNHSLITWPQVLNNYKTNWECFFCSVTEH